MMSYAFCATVTELLPALAADRDPRIEFHRIGSAKLLYIKMDNEGEGEFSLVVTETEAEALIAEGYCRDAR